MLECFVLVPAPHEPVVIRLDRHATIGQVKSALERKRGWPCDQQRLRLESGPYSRCDTNDAQSLVSLRLHKQALPTLQLQLMDDSSKRARTSRMPSFSGAGASEVQVEPGGDERAALDIQRITRGKHARRQCEDERLWIAVRAMCANTEARSAGRIQRKWRQSRAAVCAAREAREVDAAGAIQRVHRNRQRRLNPKRNQAAWLREMLEQAEDSQSEYSQSEHSTTRESSPLGSRSQRLSAGALPASSSPRSSGSLRSPNQSPANLTVAFTSVEKTPAKQAQPARTAGAAQVIGVVDKESGFRAWGTWQLVTWSRRWMFTTHEALCYRHVRPGSQMPRGKTTSIAFRTVQRVGVHSDEPTVLFLDCATRQYFFRFPSAVLCETFAARIAVAAAQGSDA